MTQDLSPIAFQALSEFRYHIRRFLHFSEVAARQEGLEPQQHQALLALRALHPSAAPTIGDLAARLLVQHHSAVGLIDRLASRGLVERTPGEQDRRQVHVHLTPSGAEVLKRLSAQHRDELRTSGPLLVSVLQSLLEGGDDSEEENV